MGVPAYTSEELVTRITEQSVDLNRLAATVAEQHAAIVALTSWANAVNVQMQPVESNPPQPVKPARR